MRPPFILLSRIIRHCSMQTVYCSYTAYSSHVVETSYCTWHNLSFLMSINRKVIAFQRFTFLSELVRWYQKVHFAIFWIFWCKFEDNTSRRTDNPDGLHPMIPSRLIGAPISAIPPFLRRMPFLAQPSNLSWLGTGIKCAGGLVVLNTVDSCK